MLDEHEVRAGLQKLLNERLTTRQLATKEGFDDNDTLNSLELDSLDKVELWMATEDYFKIKLEENDVMKLSTVGELVYLVLSKSS